MKKLSIVTICYNEPNLERTCESIINQTWQDFEWIVIDGGSDKETQKIWDKYKHKIDKFVSEPDNGIYNACNKGIKLAQGEWINFMNAGDVYAENNVLEKVFNKNEYENIDILYGDEYFVDYTNNIKTLNLMPKELTLNYLIIDTIRHQSSFIKRNLFNIFGQYDEAYKIVSDWEKWLIFKLSDRTFKYIPFTIANYNISGRSFSSESSDCKQSERATVLFKYLSEKEILKALYSRYTFLEKIFSLKNSINKNTKIITILGIHIKIKRRIK